MTQQEQMHLDELESNGIEQTKKMCEQHGYIFEQANTEHRAYDCFITNPNTGNKSICEIKNRYNSDKYDTLFMEVDKCERLLKWKAKYNCYKSFYINVLGSTLYIFEIDESTMERYKPTTRWMNAETFRSNKKVSKQVIELPKADAKIIYNN